LARDLEANQSECKRLEAELESAREQLSSSVPKETLSKLEAACDELRESNDALRVELKNATEKITSLEAKGSEALDDLSGLVQAGAEADALRAQLEARADAAEGRVEQMDSAMTDLRRQAESSRTEADDAKADLTKLQAELEDLRVKHAAELEQTRAELTRPQSPSPAARSPTKSDQVAPSTPEPVSRNGTAASPTVSPALARAFLGALTTSLTPMKATRRQGEDTIFEPDGDDQTGSADVSRDEGLSALADAASSFITEHELLSRAKDRLRDLR